MRTVKDSDLIDEHLDGAINAWKSGKKSKYSIYSTAIGMQTAAEKTLTKLFNENREVMDYLKDH